MELLFSEIISRDVKQSSLTLNISIDGAFNVQALICETCPLPDFAGRSDSFNSMTRTLVWAEDLAALVLPDCDRCRKNEPRTLEAIDVPVVSRVLTDLAT